MSSVGDFLSTLHLIVLLIFVVGTSTAMVGAVLCRVRIRRSLLVWRAGPLIALPLGPSLFLLLVGCGLTLAWGTGRTVPLAVLLGYPAGGVFWFIATWMVQAVVVTEEGFVHDLTRPHQAVAWEQVYDYFTVTRSGQEYFVFVHRGPDGCPRRIDLPVPDAQVNPLQRIVRRKLDSRFGFSVQQSIEDEVIDRFDDRIDLL